MLSAELPLRRFAGSKLCPDPIGCRQVQGPHHSRSERRWCWSWLGNCSHGCYVSQQPFLVLNCSCCGSQFSGNCSHGSHTSQLSLGFVLMCCGPRLVHYCHSSHISQHLCTSFLKACKRKRIQKATRKVSADRRHSQCLWCWSLLRHCCYGSHIIQQHCFVCSNV